jgi:hypothetical protein
MPEDPPSRLDTEEDAQEDKDKKKHHRAGELFQAEHAADQGADEVGLENKDQRKEGRTDTAVNQPSGDRTEETPSRGQSIKGSGRSAPDR